MDNNFKKTDSNSNKPIHSFVNDPPRDLQNSSQVAAAANIVRKNIDNIYALTGNKKIEPIHNSDLKEGNKQLKYTNPYDKTRANNTRPEMSRWRQYHTAWQNYYQKYYEQYYLNELNKVTNSFQLVNNNTNKSTLEKSTDNVLAVAERQSSEDTKKEAIKNLRNKLKQQVTESSKKVAHSKHFIPIISALLVMLIFIFLQYNNIIFGFIKAYIAPGNVNAQSIILSSDSSYVVTKDSRLIIPKINVDAPIIFGVSNTDTKAQMAAMNNGVIDFPISGADAVPGQIGNFVLSGHSSNDVFASGDYKFIFAQLDRLSKDDIIYVNYNGKRYTYAVTKTEVVVPTDVSKLVYTTDKPVLTLITCTPLGTDYKRLLVTAEQIDPDPSAAEQTSTAQSSTSKSIPGGTQSILEKLFGIN
jgi:sortase A